MCRDISISRLEEGKMLVGSAAWVIEGLLYGQTICTLSAKVWGNRYFEGAGFLCWQAFKTVVQFWSVYLA
jgi:hypothetical protein